jgi:hypothetical protein
VEKGLQHVLPAARGQSEASAEIVGSWSFPRMMVVATWSVLPAKRHTRRKNSSPVSRAERVANRLHAEHQMESSVVRICEYLKDFTCSSPARRLDQSMRIKAAGPAVLVTPVWRASIAFAQHNPTSTSVRPRLPGRVLQCFASDAAIQRRKRASIRRTQPRASNAYSRHQQARAE